MSSTAPLLTVELESPDLAKRGVPIAEMPVHSIVGEDALSRLFEFTVGVVYRDPKAEPLDLAAFLDAEIAVVFRRDGVEVRRLYGIVRQVLDRMNHLDEEDVVLYDLVVVPRVWHLACVERFAIYLDKSVPEIFASLLENLDFAEGTDFELRLIGHYPTREFVLQYRETDLAFLMRLAEHVGIAFHFDHSSGVDKLVFTDHAHAFRDLPSGSLPFNATGKATDVYALDRSFARVPEIAYCLDYDYRQPMLELSAAYQVAEVPTGGIIDYGGNFTSEAEGEALARVRVEERQVAGDVYRGKADVQSLFAGAVVSIHGHSRQVPSLLVTRAIVEGRQPASGLADVEAGYFRVHFDASPSSRTFRPARVTPRPRIHGLLPAVVETDDLGTVLPMPVLDSLGRYRVRFKFDNVASASRHGSHWVRLAQPLAGPGYGWSFPIRPGVEVMIAFEDGDPDRPVIVGAMHNARLANPVTVLNPSKNRLVSESGVLFEIDDGSGI